MTSSLCAHAVCVYLVVLCVCWCMCMDHYRISGWPWSSRPRRSAGRTRCIRSNWFTWFPWDTRSSSTLTSHRHSNTFIITNTHHIQFNYFIRVSSKLAVCLFPLSANDICLAEYWLCWLISTGRSHQRRTWRERFARSAWTTRSCWFQRRTRWRLEGHQRCARFTRWRWPCRVCWSSRNTREPRWEAAGWLNLRVLRISVNALSLRSNFNYFRSNGV